MPNIKLEDIQNDIENAVRTALEEDIGSGDITAELIPAEQTNTATVITREDCVLCGTAWFDEVFLQLGGIDSIEWHFQDGDSVSANSTLVTLSGNTRKLLTGERSALNFLQLLCGVATKARKYAKLVEGTKIKVLDTRKTIPGLRTAQKYAVNIGGCHNHRIGLYDAFLIKENHIAACGGIEKAITTARQNHPGKLVEVEVENLEELQQAIDANADVVMLDNFDEENLLKASEFERGKTKFELSGNLESDQIKANAGFNVDFCSSGDLTKNCEAIDLSLKLSGA